jgi:hypothetical protein
MSDVNSKQRMRKIITRILKATIKGLFFYIIYFGFITFSSPITEIVPNFKQTIETFVFIYIFFIFIGELTSGTIYQHFFNVTRAFYVILYMIYSLGNGIIGFSFEGIHILVDLSLFLMFALLLSLLGLVKTIMQAINFMNKKTEHAYI